MNRLELVEFVFKEKKNIELKETIIVGAQHLLPSTLSMLKSFFDRGLPPQNVFLIGKCYSTDIATYKSLKKLGTYICPSSKEFKKNFSFDSFYSKSIKEFANHVIQSLAKNEALQVIVLDDGGDLIQCLNGIEQTNLRFACLEQTSAGYEKIKNLTLKIPVVNVARSEAKLKIESKIVVRTAIASIIENTENIKSGNVLIFGNGAIGGALANALEGKFNVSLVDINPSKSPLSLQKTLSKLATFNLIIGCTGKTVLSEKQINTLKPGTTLISLSSSDREFDITDLRKKSMLIKSCHNNFTTSEGVQILNCGFPINFTSNAKKVDIKEFELTRSLLTVGILQAIDLKEKKGIFKLDQKYQALLTHEYLKKYSYKANRKKLKQLSS